jgi:hypothetical protein
MQTRSWTAEDAVGKNATMKRKPKLQKLCADTANGTLRSETEKGTEASQAEGIAIVTANKAVNAKLRSQMGNSGRPPGMKRGYHH